MQADCNAGSVKNRQTGFPVLRSAEHFYPACVYITLTAFVTGLDK